jgi:hypothetical protein
MQPTPWSHSALESLLNCPRQFHEVKILKNFSDDTEANQWGQRAHKTFQVYLDGGVLPEEFEQYRGYLDAIRAIPGEHYNELKLALDTLLNPCDFFRGRNLFCRGVIDTLIVHKQTAKAIDHKFGKRHPDNKQMRRMAILIFQHFHEVQVLNVAFMWLQTGERDSEIIRRSDIPDLWAEVLPDLQVYKRTFELDLWPPRQSGLCKKHCPVLTCEFNGRNR